MRSCCTGATAPGSRGRWNGWAADTLAAHPDADGAVAVAGRLSRRLAVPAPPWPPRLRDRAEERAEELRRGAARLPGALPERVVGAAVATVLEPGHDQPDTLVHGDPHFGDVLRADRDPWPAVDPEGHAGDPAHDAITVLRSRHETLLAAPDTGAAVLRRPDSSPRPPGWAATASPAGPGPAR
ncbi:aminoglycoside phosphotransferase family protein [Kitasatospora sp. NPDC056327]|uniref:aminoglycoside phosphotransferase family protein n=1 Tax=Kitasatospora sp. NPDC056327 TaxID=3345785 RepID=UPI0035E26F41